MSNNIRLISIKKIGDRLPCELYISEQVGIGQINKI